jgi:hypothetical protein
MKKRRAKPIGLACRFSFADLPPQPKFDRAQCAALLFGDSKSSIRQELFHPAAGAQTSERQKISVAHRWLRAI